MSADDENELRWWREAFATRFVPGGLPKPGTALYGLRLRVVTTDGDEVDEYGRVQS